jgi:predicted aminopeptidase
MRIHSACRSAMLACKRRLRLPGLLAAAACLSGCATLGYYGQAIHGELSLLSARRPIGALLADPHTPAALREKLRVAEQIRSFASAKLGLPDNASYTSYVALTRPYVSWNVFATPPFSLQPVNWCFLFAGCVPYRGYFSRQAARQFAAALRAQGDDVYVAGVPAFSTLGWFDDPLLSSMLAWNDSTLANYIFHELAHQELYVKGDAEFNESYAVLVADVGVRRWLQASGRGGQLQTYQAGERHWRLIVQLVDAARARLAQVYSSGASRESMQRRKQKVFDALRRGYAALRPQLDGDNGYDLFFDAGLNNASLLTISTYTRWVPAFRALLAQQHGNLPGFYRAVKRLAKLPPPQRQAALQQLMPANTAS